MINYFEDKTYNRLKIIDQYQLNLYDRYRMEYTNEFRSNSIELLFILISLIDINIEQFS